MSTGNASNSEAAADITARLGDHADLLADLIAIEQPVPPGVSSYAQPLIDSVTPGGPNVVDIGTADRGKAEFDQIRSAVRHPECSFGGGADRRGQRAGRDAQLA